MKKIITYLLVFSIGIALNLAGNETGFAGSSTAGPTVSVPFKNLLPAYQTILQQVAEWSADLAYDYDSRPLIRTIILDFHDPAGRETAAGNDLSAFLRTGLNRESQFYLYGREQVRRSLGHFIPANRNLSPALIQRLQELAPIVFKKPIHLLVAGEIQKAGDQQLGIKITLIPFFQQLTPVGLEAESLSFPQLSFLTPKLTDEELTRALAPPPIEIRSATLPNYGRLVILSNYLLEKQREQERRYLGTLESTTLTSYERGPAKALRELQLGDPQDLTCWLDKQELFIFDGNQIVQLKDYYFNILSGFEADQIWFDAEVKEGEHQLAFSVFPVNSINKRAVSYPFKLRAGATTYLIVSVVSQNQKDPEVSIKMVVDPQNKIYPF